MRGEQRRRREERLDVKRDAGELESIPACPDGQANGRSLRSARNTASSGTTPNEE